MFDQTKPTLNIGNNDPKYERISRRREVLTSTDVEYADARAGDMTKTFANIDKVTILGWNLSNFNK